jgi:hypothetical protein
MGCARLRTAQRSQLVQKRMPSRRTALLLLASNAQSRQTPSQSGGSCLQHPTISRFSHAHSSQKQPERREFCPQMLQQLKGSNGTELRQSRHHASSHVLSIERHDRARCTRNEVG